MCIRDSIQPILHTKNTDLYKEELKKLINFNIPLKSPEELDIALFLLLLCTGSMDSNNTKKPFEVFESILLAQLKLVLEYNKLITNH